jgi:hypothetical protein
VADPLDPLHIALAGSITGALVGGMVAMVGNAVARVNREQRERSGAVQAIEAEVDYAAKQAAGF